MTDYNEITKGLKELELYNGFQPKIKVLVHNAIYLINRQKEEIERLEVTKNDYKSYYEKTVFLLTEAYKTAEQVSKNWEIGKINAIKEFAERLTDIICDNLNRSLDNPNGNDYFITDVYTTINNLVKEMTEVN